MQKLHCAVSVQSCPTLCKPMDYGPSGSSIHGVFQAGMWSGFPFPTLGDLPDPGIKPTCLASPHWQAQIHCATLEAQKRHYSELYHLA